jgi:hypothetical protein
MQRRRYKCLWAFACATALRPVSQALAHNDSGGASITAGDVDGTIRSSGSDGSVNGGADVATGVACHPRDDDSDGTVAAVNVGVRVSVGVAESDTIHDGRDDADGEVDATASASPDEAHRGAAQEDQMAEPVSKDPQPMHVVADTTSFTARAALASPKAPSSSSASVSFSKAFSTSGGSRSIDSERRGAIGSATRAAPRQAVGVSARRMPREVPLPSWMTGEPMLQDPRNSTALQVSAQQDSSSAADAIEGVDLQFGDLAPTLTTAESECYGAVPMSGIALRVIEEHNSYGTAAKGYFCPTCDVAVWKWTELTEHFAASAHASYSSYECSLALREADVMTMDWEQYQRMVDAALQAQAADVGEGEEQHGATGGLDVSATKFYEDAAELISPKMHAKLIAAVAGHPEGMKCSQVVKEVKGLVFWLKSLRQDCGTLAGKKSASPMSFLRVCPGLRVVERGDGSQRIVLAETPCSDEGATAAPSPHSSAAAAVTSEDISADSFASDEEKGALEATTPATGNDAPPHYQTWRDARRTKESNKQKRKVYKAKYGHLLRSPMQKEKKRLKKLKNDMIKSQGFQCSTCGVFHGTFSAMRKHWWTGAVGVRGSPCARETMEQCSVALRRGQRVNPPSEQPGDASVSPQYEQDGDDNDDDDDADDDADADDDDEEEGEDYIDDDTWVRGRGDVPEAYCR